MSHSSAKKSLKRYASWDNILFIVILLSVGSYVFFQVVILKTTSPQVAVTTTSMVPTYEGFNLTENPNLQPPQYYDILRGDLLIVQNIEPHVGDVAVFKAPGQSTPIVHRLVAERMVNGTLQFATKGDNNPTSDLCMICIGNHFGWINRSAVLGIVVFDIHYLGWFSLQLENSIIRTIFIIATIGIIAYAVYDSTKSSGISKGKKQNETKSITKHAYLKIKSHKIQIHRPKLFFFIILGLLLTTYVGSGVVNYSTGYNTVHSSIQNNSVINLESGTNIENFTNIYFYDYQMNIISSGFLNTVSRVVVTPIYNNVTTTVTNPSYVWTIVYDFAGSKSINPLLVFNTTSIQPNTSINTTLQYKIYSSGLLASPVRTLNINVTIIV